jgi:hypothetical protein
MIIQPIRWVHHGLSPRVLNANALRAKSLHANERIRAELNAEKRCDVFAKTKRKSCLQIPPIYLIHVCLQRQWNHRYPLFTNKRPIRTQSARVAKRQASNAPKEPPGLQVDGLLVAPKPKEGIVVIKA